jgi:hypothetical protein
MDRRSGAALTLLDAPFAASQAIEHAPLATVALLHALGAQAATALVLFHTAHVKYGGGSAVSNLVRVRGEALAAPLPAKRASGRQTPLAWDFKKLAADLKRQKGPRNRKSEGCSLASTG